MKGRVITVKFVWTDNTERESGEERRAHECFAGLEIQVKKLFGSYKKRVDRNYEVMMG